MELWLSHYSEYVEPWGWGMMNNVGFTSGTWLLSWRFSDVIVLEEELHEPWLVWLSGLGVVLKPKRSQLDS